MGLLNPFVIKKWIALLVPAILGVTTYAILTVMYGPIIAIFGYLAALIISLLIGSALLANPFTNMLEGQGILAMNIDSTGIITPFLINVNSPYMVGKLQGRPLADIFDREAVMQIAHPRTRGGFFNFFNRGDKLVGNTGKLNVTTKTTDKGVETIAEERGVHIYLAEPLYNQARFMMFNWPVIIYNNQVKSVLTKDFLSEFEKDTFAEHSILYLNRKLEELSSITRDFARYVVETLKPKGSFLGGSWWIWVIIGIVGVILIAMFGPAILSAIKGPGGNAIANAGTTISGGVQQIVTPRG